MYRSACPFPKWLRAEFQSETTRALLVTFVGHHYEWSLEPCTCNMKHAYRSDDRFKPLEPFILSPSWLWSLAETIPELELEDLNQPTGKNPTSRPGVFRVTLKGRPFEVPKINDKDKRVFEEFLMQQYGSTRDEFPQAHGDLGLAYELLEVVQRFKENPKVPQWRLGELQLLVAHLRAKEILYWNPVSINGKRKDTLMLRPDVSTSVMPAPSGPSPVGRVQRAASSTTLAAQSTPAAADLMIGLVNTLTAGALPNSTKVPPLNHNMELPVADEPPQTQELSTQGEPNSLTAQALPNSSKDTIAPTAPQSALQSSSDNTKSGQGVQPVRQRWADMVSSDSETEGKTSSTQDTTSALTALASGRNSKPVAAPNSSEGVKPMKIAGADVHSSDSESEHKTLIPQDTGASTKGKGRSRHAPRRQWRKRGESQ